jgi:hypothetical protein
MILEAVDNGLEFTVRTILKEGLDRPLLTLGQNQRLPL